MGSESKLLMVEKKVEKVHVKEVGSGGCKMFKIDIKSTFFQITQSRDLSYLSRPFLK